MYKFRSRKIWAGPQNVLFRYQMFLRHKEELKHFDYLFFFNGNTEFLQIITPEEFLPTEKEALTVWNGTL